MAAVAIVEVVVEVVAAVVVAVVVVIVVAIAVVTDEAAVVLLVRVGSSYAVVGVMAWNLETTLPVPMGEFLQAKVAMVPSRRVVPTCIQDMPTALEEVLYMAASVSV